MLRRPPICGSLRLRTTAQEYVLESDGDDSGTALRLQRSQTDEVIVTQLPPMSGYGELGESVPIVGVVGVVHLLSGPYILVVAGADLVGKVLGHDVYRVADVRILPFAADLSGLSAPQQQDEQLYLAMLRTFLTSRHLYFSYTMDLTSSLQEQSAWTPEHQRSPIWRTADSRFFWNEALVRPLTAISGGCDSFILPIVLGFASVSSFDLGGQRCGLALLSRKSKLRAGTRYNTRGVSRDGQAANFAETEQILWTEESGSGGSRPAHVCAYLQTRGSAPVLWSQPVDLRYNPPFHFADELSMEARAAFRAHAEEQRARYGTQVLVSLLDNVGPEAALQRQLRHHVDSYNGELRAGSSGQVGALALGGEAAVCLVDFDFHHLCRNMQYQNLSILVEQCEAHIRSHGYFEADDAQQQQQQQQQGQTSTAAAAEPQKRQSGCFRTNCKDALDRTNVVQTVFAERFLVERLRTLGLLGAGESLGHSPQLNEIFMHSWADNADALAMAYVGTPALKTDFTRTGKRTIRGAAMDGWHSAHRYFLGNFTDGFRQDAFDLFLVNYRCDLDGQRRSARAGLGDDGSSSGEGSVPSLSRGYQIKWQLKTFAALIGFSLFMVVATLFGGRTPVARMCHVFIWMAVAAGTSKVVLMHGPQFVCRPQLCPDVVQHGLGSAKSRAGGGGHLL